MSFPGQRWLNETIFDIESAIGGSGDDTMIGDGRANTFQGGAGEDILRGRGGNDTLSGGLTEKLVFLYDFNELYNPNGPSVPYPVAPDDGSDIIDGGGGIDTVVYRDMVILPTGPSQSAFMEDWISPNLDVDLLTGRVRASDPTHSEDRLISIENVTTGNGDDTIQGNGAANVISCGDGTNVVRGAGGNDTIRGGRYVLEGGEGEQLFGGTGSDTIYGNGGLERFLRNETELLAFTNDRLHGGAGDDFLFAGIGRSTMTGGSGADTFSFSDEQIDIQSGDQDSQPRAFGQQVSITDFRPGDGDMIRIEITSDHHGVAPRFVGMQNPASSDVLEVGYVTVTDQNGETDTVVGMKFRPDRDSDAFNEFVALQIRLEGYDAGLSQDNFLFV